MYASAKIIKTIVNTLMIVKGVSKSELLKKSKVCASSLNNLLNGKSTRITAMNSGRLLKALGFKPSYAANIAKTCNADTLEDKMCIFNKVMDYLIKDNYKKLGK